MELCANPSLSNAPPFPYCRLPPTAVNRRFRPSFHLNHTVFSLRSISGNVSCKHSSPKANMSEESPSKFDGETSGRVVVVEDVSETRQEDIPLDEELQPFGELLDKFSLKVDTDDSYSYILYGGGGLISIWLLSAVVGAIDSIPLFPKFLEVVGLSYSLWFTTRYLLFKENRDELGAKIEQLKQQVFGLDDN